MKHFKRSASTGIHTHTDWIKRNASTVRSDLRITNFYVFGVLGLAARDVCVNVITRLYIVITNKTSLLMGHQAQLISRQVHIYMYIIYYMYIYLL